MTDFNAEPYWDDFEATNGALEKNYMRILFRPGYAVQARELTQIQSIVQNQIKKFGNHVFKDGSPVDGGHMSIDTNVVYIKIAPQQNGVDVDLENFLGLVVFNQGLPRTKAKVIQTYSTSTEATLLVKYIRGPGFSAGETISTISGATATILSPTFTGYGSTVTINSGVFYVNGFFVSVQPQTIVLDAYSSAPTYRVGLQIDETIVTESEDTNLLDPAQESFNYQAPGGHRYQFDLLLTKRSLTSTDDSRFFELLRVENGVITQQVSYPVYSELEKTLARRTYDESGDYTVRPFTADVSANNSNSNQFLVNISPGKAYVKGTEFETIGTRKIPIDRALTTKTSSGYNLSSYYGNRVYVANVQSSSARGLIASESLIPVDIHCVPANSAIATLNGNTANYYSTRIGTGKIRNLEGTGTANVFYAYLTDMKFDPIITSTTAASVNNFTLNLRSEFSSSSNAYLNAKVTLISTSGVVGEFSKVTSYDGTNKLLYVYPAFTNPPGSGDIISISMPFGDSESFIAPNTAAFSSANLSMNVSIFSKDSTGSAVLEDSSYDKEVFTLPSYYVTRDSDKSVTIFRKVIFKDQTFAAAGSNANASISVSGTGLLPFGTDSAYVDTAAIKQNIIVVANNGQVLDMTSGNRSVYRTTPTNLILDAQNMFGSNFTADVYLTTKIVNANTSTSRRVKTLKSSNSSLTTFDTLAAATQVPGVGSVYLNMTNGVAWFTNANSIVTNTFEKQSLYVSDVVRVKAIYQSGNINYAPNSTNFTDITNRYLLDSGQTDQYYDYASIRLKPDAQPPSGQTAVFFDYYEHTGTGYLSATSYPAADYNSESIPVYRSDTGEIYYLRDSIDFRPVRQYPTTVDPFIKTSLNATVNVSVGSVLVQSNTARTAGSVIVPPLTVGSIIKVGGDQRTVNSVINVTAVTVSSPFTATATNSTLYAVTQNTASFTGGIIHVPTNTVTLDYDFYLPRIDKIVVTKDKKFKVLVGVPSSTPIEPADDPESSMTIYKVYVPSFTASLRNVTLDFVDNRRYTMKDIAALDARIKSIEKYIQLKESEQTLINNPPKTGTINKPIYGIIVDDFNDLSVADTTNDFSASVELGYMSCYRNITPLSLQLSSVNTAKLGNKFLTLAYSETPAVTQGLATLDGSETVVADSLIAKFNGYLTLTPESDYYYSTEHIPSFSDIAGMYFQLPQSTKPTTTSMTTTVVNQMGGGQYTTLTSNSSASTVTGTGVNIVNQSTVTIPAASSNTAQTEPTTTNQINTNFTGVMPFSYLGNYWAGVAAMSGVSVDPNMFDPASQYAQALVAAMGGSYYGVN